MTKTENYQLNQWVPEDRVTHTDFNEDNAKIDAALHALEQGKADTTAVNTSVASLKNTMSSLQTAVNASYSSTRQFITTGLYIGNGNATRIIDLGFTPLVVLVFTGEGYTYDGYSYMGGLAFLGANISSGLSVVTNGFQVAYSGSSVRSNNPSTRYYYIAFR